MTFEGYVRVLQERMSLVLNGERKESRSGTWMTTRRMRLVEELIDDRLGTKLTVQDLSSALGLSAGFFSRALKAAIGKTPHDYIIDRRIARARALLASQHCSLSAVAYEVGFSSHAHMANAFRQRLGVTPSEYRKYSTR
ncbi:MAG: helix-turn-helix transcriptional regulator [Candidatus Competibacteraceae bacterium]|nr:helix-turn-helix transcriptional regulator [Candidatus Competibacteraceae bacterium]